MIRYRVCSVCQRRRRFTVEPESHGPEDPGERWTCSKGHTSWMGWTTFKKVNEVLKEVYIPLVRAALDRPSPFWRLLK